MRFFMLMRRYRHAGGQLGFALPQCAAGDRQFVDQLGNRAGHTLRRMPIGSGRCLRRRAPAT